MNYNQFFINTNPIVPTFYDELGLATVPQADGSSSTRVFGDQTTIDFSGSDLDTYLSFGMGKPYVPLDGPSFFSYDLLRPSSWNTDDLFDPGNSGLPSASSSIDTSFEASMPFIQQVVQNTERQFALNISNDPGRIGEQIPQPLPESSSGVSASKVETPMTFLHTEEKFNASTSSSSPTGKSAKQRRKATLSTPNNTKKAGKASARSEATPGNPQGKKFCCLVNECPVTFADESMMRRHIVSKHLKIHPACPGCKKAYSRKDSVGRHVNTRPVGSNCRKAAKENGWTEGEDGRLKMPEEWRVSRVDIVAAAYPGLIDQLPFSL